MTMGRGSCTKVTLIVMLVIIWSPIESYAASHVVGDNQGWGFSVSYSDWAKGKSFASGDTLGLFSYVLILLAYCIKVLGLFFSIFFFLTRLLCLSVLAVFNYQPGLHNVVLVTAAGYKNCKAPGAAEAATSGNDNLTLKKGANYFICSIPGHCSAGMKLQVVAE